MKLNNLVSAATPVATTQKKRAANQSVLKKLYNTLRACLVSLAKF